MPEIHLKLSRVFSALLISASCFSLVSCATTPPLQGKVNSLLNVNAYPQAASILEKNPNAYGRNNKLLYLLEAGYVSHLAGEYNQSVDFFQKAKQIYDELFTRSASEIALTWLLNDTASSYRGEDFERVIINIFQSLNYLEMGNLEDALVEVRDLNNVLSVINTSYAGSRENSYNDDGFARLLMGIIFEANKTKEDFNNAFIAYAKAVSIYEEDNFPVPRVLKENILSAAGFMGVAELNKYLAKYGQAKYLSLDDKAKKAEVYLIQYNGFSPVKREGILPLVFSDGYVVQFAFPRYDSRPYYIHKAVFQALNNRRQFFKTDAELAQNIGALAVKSLNRRKLRVLAKATASSAGKYIIERKQEENIRKKYGNDTAVWFKIASSLFNIFSSRADLRCWQSLPDEIRVARLILEPGEYTFSMIGFDSGARQIDKQDVGKAVLLAGEKKFFIIRSAQ